MFLSNARRYTLLLALIVCYMGVLRGLGLTSYTCKARQGQFTWCNQEQGRKCNCNSPTLGFRSYDHIRKNICLYSYYQITSQCLLIILIIIPTWKQEWVVIFRSPVYIMLNVSQALRISLVLFARKEHLWLLPFFRPY